MTLDRPATVRPDLIQPETRAAVDELYAGDAVAAFRAIDAATADPTADVRGWELGPAERSMWEAGYMVGFAAAGTELHAELDALRAQLDQAQQDADRYYTEMCRRAACPESSTSRSSHAKLSQIRGEHDRADYQDAAIDRMFPQWAGVRPAQSDTNSNTVRHS